MRVPFLDLKAQYKTIQKEIKAKVDSILASQVFALGPEVECLEKELAAFCGVKHAIGVSSGTDALLVSLMALDIMPGDMVVTTPFTFFATAGVVARLQAVPVFCDIDPLTFNLSAEKLDFLLRKLKKRPVKALIPVHLYGQCAEMDPLSDIARHYHLSIIEDAAQAIGAEYPSRRGNKKAGSMGTLGTISFYPTKNLGAYGDAGLILTNNTQLAERIKIMRVHGEKRRYHYEIVGGNFRLDALQAGILRVKLPFLSGWQKRRRQLASLYEKLFEERGLTSRGYVTCPQAVYRNREVENYHTYHQYVVRVKKRDELKRFLERKGIQTAIFYPKPLHLQKCFAYLGYKRNDFPAAEKAAREVLALPIYPELTADQVAYVVENIAAFFRS